MTINIKDFYINIPMERFKYMKLNLSNLPKDFINKYDLAPKFDQNGYVYVEMDAECTDFHKQDSLPNSCYKNA